MRKKKFPHFINIIGCGVLLVGVIGCQWISSGNDHVRVFEVDIKHFGHPSFFWSLFAAVSFAIYGDFQETLLDSEITPPSIALGMMGCINIGLQWIPIFIAHFVDPQLSLIILYMYSII